MRKCITEYVSVQEIQVIKTTAIKNIRCPNLVKREHDNIESCRKLMRIQINNFLYLYIISKLQTVKVLLSQTMMCLGNMNIFK